MRRWKPEAMGAPCCSWAAACPCRPFQAPSHRALSQTPQCTRLPQPTRLPSSARPQQVHLCISLWAPALYLFGAQVALSDLGVIFNMPLARFTSGGLVRLQLCSSAITPYLTCHVVCCTAGRCQVTCPPTAFGPGVLASAVSCRSAMQALAPVLQIATAPCRIFLCSGGGKLHSVHSTGDVSRSCQCSWGGALWHWLRLGQCGICNRCGFSVCEHSPVVCCITVLEARVLCSNAL